MAYAAISKPSLHINPVLYTSNGTVIGSGGLSVTGFGFQPDWLGIKLRDQDESWGTYDSVRGVYEGLRFNGNEGESTESEGVTAFDADGFTCGNQSRINPSGSEACVAYGWKAGTTTGITTNGSTTITPLSYSFNPTSNFSIIKYTGNGLAGAGIPHGLGSKAAFFMCKKLDTSDSWQIYHEGLGSATKYLILNNNDPEGSNVNRWNSTEPDTVNCYLGTEGAVNLDEGTFVAYCFSEVKGYSKFGSYVGNSSTDGPMIFTGFKPAWVLIKATSGGEGWTLFDNKRLGYNVDNNYLTPNTGVAEATSDDIDFLSNGFKLRTLGSHVNASGITSYVYSAFAEEPLVANVGSGIPATAR